MTFEFTLDTKTEEISIIYDNSIVITAWSDGHEIHYNGFEKVDDDDVEKILKNLCKSVINTIA